jgi:competence protein ComGB
MQRRLTISQQVKLIQLMHSLFVAGFSLKEIVSFLDRSHLVSPVFVATMTTGLENGRPLSDLLADLKFSPNVVTQVSLAEHHGNLIKTLDLVQVYLTKQQKLRRKLAQVATYPIILVLFLIGIMVGLNDYLLPQLEGGDDNFANRLIQIAPIAMLYGSVGLVILALVITLYIRRQPALWMVSHLSRFPILGGYLRDYYTAFYAREWGNLLSQGLEMRQILVIMQGQKSRLFVAVGHDLETRLNRGQSFTASLQAYHFLKRELALMAEFGELKSKLGIELMVYSDECWDRFFRRLNRATQWVQPIIFIVVALMIVLIYAAMLLPIYDSMQTVF